MDALEQYIADHTSPEETLLRELDRETHLRTVQPRMISGHVQGKLLEMIVRMLRPRNILEIGTFTGYSALCMAAGLGEDGHLDTCEIDDELTPLSQSFFDRSPHGHKITQHIGSVLEVVPELGKTFDLVFIDGDKREYPDYYRMLMGDTMQGHDTDFMESTAPGRDNRPTSGNPGTRAGGDRENKTPDKANQSFPALSKNRDAAPKTTAQASSSQLVHSGSVLIADNILWYGKVTEPVRPSDRHTQAILEFNRMVREDNRVENVILPLRDGLNLIRVK